jgi:hypothetical protein
LHLQRQEFSLVIHALLQLGDNEDAYNLASHLEQAAQAQDRGEIGEGCLACVRTHINPSDEGSYVQLMETGKNIRYHPIGRERGKTSNREKGTANATAR